jgi:hypothetical protein
MLQLSEIAPCHPEIGPRFIAESSMSIPNRGEEIQIVFGLSVIASGNFLIAEARHAQFSYTKAARTQQETQARTILNLPE